MKKINFTLILFLYIKLSYAQSDFEKHISIDSSTWFWNIVKINANKDILVFGIDDWDYQCAYMLDSNGNMKWSHRYYIPIDPIHNNYPYYSFKDFAFTNEGGFMLTGSTSDSTYKPALALFRFDSTGNLMWTKRHHFYRGDYGISILPRLNGNFALCAGTKKTYQWATLPAIHFLIIDSIGNILKSKRIGNDSIRFSPASMKAIGNNYIIEGEYASYNPQRLGCFLMKLDNGGNVLKTKFLDGVWSERGMEITHNNKILFGFRDGPDDFNLMKLDEDLNVNWCKTILPSVAAMLLPSIAESPDSNYLMFGFRWISTSSGPVYGVACKIDTAGNVISAFQINYLNSSEGAKISSYGNKIFFHALAAPVGQLTESLYFTTDVNLNATCFTSPIPLHTIPYFVMDSLITINYYDNYFPVHEDSIYVTTYPLNYFIEDICSPTIINETTTDNLFFISPNPFTSSLSITLQNQNIKQATISIKNILGQTVFTFSKVLNFGKGYCELDLSFLSQGIYLLEVNANGGPDSYREVRKIVKE